MYQPGPTFSLLPLLIVAIIVASYYFWIRWRKEKHQFYLETALAFSWIIVTGILFLNFFYMGVYPIIGGSAVLCIDVFILNYIHTMRQKLRPESQVL